MFRQILINDTLQNGKRDQKIELSGRSLLRRQKLALDYNAFKEEEEEAVN